MAPSKRSAAEVAREAIKAEQESGHVGDDNHDTGAENMASAAPADMMPPKTPTRAFKPVTASATKSSTRKRKADKAAWPWTHHLPTTDQIAETTREMGRNLVPWQRVRMAEKFLLMIEYECTRQGIAIPWDDIAHRFHPGATAAGVQQHLARLRPILAAEGHMIPPKLPNKKYRAPVDSTIRGYVRESITNGHIVVRPIQYTEPTDHLTCNRSDAHDVHIYDAADAEQEDDDEESTPTKARKLTGARLGSAAKVKRSRRRTRIPITYMDLDSPDSEEEDADSEDEDRETAVANNKDGVTDIKDGEKEGPLAPIKHREDVSIEQLAFDMYMRDLDPRVISPDEEPKYFVNGELMPYSQICRRAIDFFEYHGYKDPECSRAIAEHIHRNPRAAQSPYWQSSSNHQPGTYPSLYHPGSTSVDTSRMTQYERAPAWNNANTGQERSGPASSPGHGHVHAGIFSGHSGRSAGRVESSPAIKQDHTSQSNFASIRGKGHASYHTTPAATHSPSVAYTQPNNDGFTFTSARNNTSGEIFGDRVPAKEPGTFATKAADVDMSQGFDTAAYIRGMESQANLGPVAGADPSPTSAVASEHGVSAYADLPLGYEHSL